MEGNFFHWGTISFEVKIGTIWPKTSYYFLSQSGDSSTFRIFWEAHKNLKQSFTFFPIWNIGYSAFVVLCNCIKLRKNRVKVIKSKIGIILFHLMIYRNYFRFWNWLENFKSMVLSRDLRPTLLLWASMGLSGSKIRTGSRTETEMDVVANRMSVLSGNIQVVLCFHRKIRIFRYKIFLISVSVNDKSKVKLFKY